MDKNKLRFYRQCELARAELQRVGVPKRRIYPVAHILLGVFGVRLRAPSYQSYLSNFFLFAVSNTPIPFLLLNVALWFSLEYSVFYLGLISILIGSLIGLVKARLTQLGYRRRNPKSWAELGAMQNIEEAVTK